MKKSRSVTKSSKKSTSFVSALKANPPRAGKGGKGKKEAPQSSGRVKSAPKSSAKKEIVSTRNKSKTQVVAAKVGAKVSSVVEKGEGKLIQVAKPSIADRLKLAVTTGKKAGVSGSQSKQVVTVEAQVVRPVKTRKQAAARGSTTIPVTKISRSGERGPCPSGSLNGHGREGRATENSPTIRTTAVIVKETESGVQVELFVAGDKIVYPQHGVGEVECVSKTMVGGQELHVYDIKILESGMKIRVPVTQAAANGLRRIIDKRTIEKVYDILKDRDFKIDTQTWNRRAREYSQKIKTGSVYEIAMVLRDLAVLGADKELSFGEKQMLEKAEARLVSEIALAKSRPHDKIAGELRELLS